MAAKPCHKLSKKVVSVLDLRDQGVQANLIEDLEQRVGEQAEKAIVEECMQCEEEAPVNVEEADLHQLIKPESVYFGLPKDLNYSDGSGVDSDQFTPQTVRHACMHAYTHILILFGKAGQFAGTLRPVWTCQQPA